MFFAYSHRPLLFSLNTSAVQSRGLLLLVDCVIACMDIYLNQPKRIESYD